LRTAALFRRLTKRSSDAVVEARAGMAARKTRLRVSVEIVTRERLTLFTTARTCAAR
jgi:hypothetical protein